MSGGCVQMGVDECQVGVYRWCGCVDKWVSGGCVQVGVGVWISG